MVVALLDAFDRTAADLSASPSGRWDITAGTGTNAWMIDGQYARTASTFSANTRGKAVFKQTDPGVNYGEVSALCRRATNSVDEIGILGRCNRVTTSDHRRLACVLNTGATPDRFELRYYTTYNTFTVIAQVDASVVGVTADTEFHLFRLRFTQLGLGTTLVLTAWYDGVVVFSAVTYPDFFAAYGLTNYRGFGLEVKSASIGWLASSYASFDDAKFDNLVEPVEDAVPALVAEPTLTPIAVATEGTVSGSLPVRPDTTVRVGKPWFTVRSKSCAQYETTWPRFQQGRRLWHVGHAALKEADLDTLETFLDSHLGPLTPFDFTTPEGPTAKVHFLRNTFSATRLEKSAGKVWSCEYVLEECF